MHTRAPRLGQIEIPLTLVSQNGVEHPCACLNISSSGALLHFLDENFDARVGMLFRSKMLQRGELVEVWVQVERVAAEGVGVKFRPIESD
jgi:hypothetical protein